MRSRRAMSGVKCEGCGQVGVWRENCATCIAAAELQRKVTARGMLKRARTERDQMAAAAAEAVPLGFRNFTRQNGNFADTI